MDTFRVLLTIFAIAFMNPIFAQSGERGSVPPGQSRDGAAPSDGALKGGSILPGESSGVPETSADRAKAQMRCEQLSGTLREDCLKQEGDAAAGGSKAAEILEPSDTRKRSQERAD
jgi:hypothetical protein